MNKIMEPQNTLNTGKKAKAPSVFSVYGVYAEHTEAWLKKEASCVRRN